LGTGGVAIGWRASMVGVGKFIELLQKVNGLLKVSGLLSRDVS
jgi:hypothetical protein